VHIEPKSIDRIQEIKEAADTDIYLCGGGVFAGWLLDHDLIDQLKLKLNPIILGAGTKLFGSSTKKTKWHLVDSKTFEGGLSILTYER
jgi:dihydrofolate reductase